MSALAVEPRCPSLELPPFAARTESVTKEMRWIFLQIKNNRALLLAVTGGQQPRAPVRAPGKLCHSLGPQPRSFPWPAAGCLGVPLARTARRRAAAEAATAGRAAERSSPAPSERQALPPIALGLGRGAGAGRRDQGGGRRRGWWAESSPQAPPAGSSWLPPSRVAPEPPPSPVCQSQTQSSGRGRTASP